MGNQHGKEASDVTIFFQRELNQIDRYALSKEIFVVFYSLTVTTQLCEVEVRELRPKYLLKVMKCKFYYLSRISEAMIYHSRTLSDQESKWCEGQKSTYSGPEDL